MGTLLVGSIGIALLCFGSVAAQEKFTGEDLAKQPAPKIIIKAPAVSEGKPQPFHLTSRQFGLTDQATAQRGDFKQKIFRGLNIVMDRGECPLPNQRCIANTSKSPKLGFVTKKWSLFPTFQANLSSRWWERKISGGFRFVF